jgi:hypothetical protein
MINYEEQLSSGKKQKSLKKIKSIQDIIKNIEARFGGDTKIDGRIK